MFAKFWEWLKSLFGAKPTSAPVPAPSPVPVKPPVAPPAPSPTPAPSPSPVATPNDNDSNGCYIDSTVTNPLFKGYGIVLGSEKSKFPATSHQYQFIAFNVAQIDEQKQIIGFEPGNTCYQVDANGQGTGVQVPNTVRCPSNITTRAAAAAYINALKYVDGTAGKGGVPGA